MPKRARSDENVTGGSVNVKINSQREPRELYFRIRRTTKMHNLFKSYCNRHQTNYYSVQFLFNGNRILGSSTPIDLGLRDGHEIEAMQRVDGGSGRGHQSAGSKAHKRFSQEALAYEETQPGIW